VVGVAGTDEKIHYLTHELGFDSAFNYKAATDYGAKLQEVCPAGIDVYFDNVGGPLTDAVWPQLTVHARVAVCGQIAHYNAEKLEQGPRFLWHLIIKRAKVQGLLVSDYAARWPEAIQQLATWVREGKLKHRETVAHGIENAPKAFIGMLKGENIGKQLVKLADE
jgi:NADPH-dependent curcumin reductase CurA